MILVSCCRCLCPINWSQVLSRSWRCSWSSADRRCSNYIWVIDNIIAYQGASYIRDLTVLDIGMWARFVNALDCAHHHSFVILYFTKVLLFACCIYKWHKTVKWHWLIALRCGCVVWSDYVVECRQDKSPNHWPCECYHLFVEGCHIANLLRGQNFEWIYIAVRKWCREWPGAKSAKSLKLMADNIFSQNIFSLISHRWCI